jgi:Tfp pilus assembly protein PilO
MIDLKGRINLGEESFLMSIGIIIAVVTIFIGYKGIYQKGTADIETARVELKVFEERLHALELLKREEEKSQLLEEKLFAEGSHLSLLEVLNKIAADLDLTIKHVGPKDVRDDGFILAEGLQMSFLSSYHDLAAFVSEVERYAPLLRIESVVLESSHNSEKSQGRRLSRYVPHKGNLPAEMFDFSHLNNTSATAHVVITQIKPKRPI